MALKPRVSAEEVLVATLSRLDPRLRLASDERFVKIMAWAAKTYPELYSEFEPHPVYGDSKLLRTVLQELDQGAAIIRENATIYYFRIAPPLAGPWGQGYYEKLDSKHREEVNAVADRISREFPEHVAE